MAPAERGYYQHLVPLLPSLPLLLMKISCGEGDETAPPHLLSPSRPPPCLRVRRQRLETSVAMGCLSLVMTPDCINGACLFVLSSAAAGQASQANRDRVRETKAKDTAARAMVAATVTLLTPAWLLAFFLLPPLLFLFLFCRLYRSASSEMTKVPWGRVVRRKVKSAAVPQ